MTATKLRIAIATAIAVYVVAGCATTTIKAYPVDWPALAVKQVCEEQAGQYVNASAETTLWRSPRNPDAGRAFLATIIVDGQLDSFSIEQVRFKYVGVDLRTQVARQYLTDDAIASVDRETTTTWTCTPEGTYRAVVNSREDNEGNAGTNTTSTFTIFRGSDASLIVHLDVRSRVAFPPGSSHEEEWLRFARKSR